MLLDLEQPYPEFDAFWVALMSALRTRVQVNVPEKKIILSERAAMLGDLLAALTAGDVVEGVVTRLTDFGAFVSLIGADGKMHGTEVGCNKSYILGPLLEQLGAAR